ncbi:unnamed protein product [Clonostachys rosea f. rosea IK726]|uniref:Uncharacterized protein n=1 Tax=Clonostachys rosea f. rosea IK726 TaxID=1349383 RepID=A0ACA9TL52_BIOOC|nr:unnamed protein product [Clonostachys rosea f. rosea IK726]
MATSRPKPPSPPVYPQEDDGIHNHFYQIQADDQRPIAWYRRRRCFYISIALAALLLIAISGGVASVIIISRHNSSHQHDEHEASTPPPAMTTSSSSSETSSSSSTTSTTEPPSTTIVSSIVTVTFTKSEESKAVETTVITLTATQTESDQDIGKMLSSMLSPFPIFTTEVVTVTADESTTSVSSSSEASSKTTSSTSTSTSSTQTSSSSPSSSPSPSPSLLPPSLFNTSNIAAVNVNIGPSNLHRRLIVWQDQDANIIAHDSANGKSKVYRVDDKLAEKGVKARSGTHLAAAADGSGAIHVFYITSDGDKSGDETPSVSHLVQREAGEWESRGQQVDVTGDSSLSATWHQSGNETKAVVLGFQSPENKICMLLLGDGNADAEPDREIVDVTQLLNLDTDGWSAIGLSIASGVPLGSTSDRNKTGIMGVYVLMEGEDEALVAECSIGNSSKSSNAPKECRWLDGVFTNADGEPIEISSHPTQLAWTLVGPGADVPPIIHGFLTLSAEGSAIDDHRLVEGFDDSKRAEAATTTLATEARSTMVSYKVEEAEIEAMAMTDERTLLVRAGTRLFEFSFVDGGWQDRREIETVLSAEED